MDLPGGISGELEKVAGNSRIYDLNKGLFAGGRLIVKQTRKGREITFTEFGSGAPVISSVRGMMKLAK